MPCRKFFSTLRFNHKRFALDQHFVNHYASKKPVFGFNGLGELVYRRSYARINPHSNKQEEWYQTVERVINGTFRLLQSHLLSHDLEYNEEHAQKLAQKMYDKIFSMKFLPGGRGLWAMGAPITEEKKLFAAVNNCSFVSTAGIHTNGNSSHPFTFLFSSCLLGIGCGFDCRGAGFYIRGVNASLPIQRHVIDDSREGWVEALKLKLDSHFCYTAPVIFDFSRLRPKGSRIKTFGGIAPGPKPLEQLLKNIDNLLIPLQNTTLQDTTIVDLMNLIAVCVVSGNVRRTAQIALGSPYSKEYLNLKNYKINPQRISYGWASNNSVYADLGMDYNEICQRIRDNGEPGLCWLENMKKYGRMKDDPNYSDALATGGAPCLEQTLESTELCNLSEMFPYNHSNNIEEFKETAKFAFLYAKIVTLGDTPWEESNKILHKNRRIGVSMSGLQQFISKYGLNTLQKYCDDTYDILKQVDKDISNLWKVNQSVKLTCIKPSGSVSLLTGSTPGMHWPESSYYLRRVRIPKDAEALVRPLLEANYPLEQASEDENTLCVSFPIAVGDDTIRSIHSVGMREQLEMASFLQRHWCDNQVSVTVSFDNAKEGDKLPEMLNEFQYKLKSVSFLPKFAKETTYAQMPYEAITKEKYQEMLQHLKPIDFKKYNSKIDIDRDMEPTKFCDKDTCQS